MIDRKHLLGAASELKAAQYFLEDGWQVYFPVVQQGVVDFIVEYSEKLARIQVKTAYWNNCDDYKYLQVRTTRNNSHEKPSTDDYDYLFVVYENQYWMIPSSKIDSTNISLLASNKNKKNRWEEYHGYLERKHTNV